eukprot:GEMP01004426.1.p1 GENE.GEMP01004426.1~~GEMP01004426.1.p1  ORF type:complete len:975 (+),score=216.39 GEMP01004426.1:125-3049(+)
MALKRLLLLNLFVPHAAIKWYVAHSLKKDSSCNEVCGTWTLQCVDSCFPKSLSSVDEALESVCKHRVVTDNATKRFHPSVNPRNGECTIGFHGSCTALSVTSDAAQEEDLWIQRVCPCGAQGQTCIETYVPVPEQTAPPESKTSAETWVVIVFLLLVVIIVVLLCMIRQRFCRKKDNGAAHKADKAGRHDVWNDKNGADDEMNSTDRFQVGMDDNVEIIEVSEVAPEPEPGRWRCDVCHFDNYEGTQCRACTRTRGVVAHRSFQTVNELVSSTSKRITDALLGNVHNDKDTGRRRSSTYCNENDFFAHCREGGPNWDGTILSGPCFEQRSPVSSPTSNQMRGIHELSKKQLGVGGVVGGGRPMHSEPPTVPLVPLMLPEPESEDVADMPRVESAAVHPNVPKHPSIVSKSSRRHAGLDSRQSREHLVDTLRSLQSQDPRARSKEATAASKPNAALCFQQPQPQSVTSGLPSDIRPSESEHGDMMASVESSLSMVYGGPGIRMPPHDDGRGLVGASPARSSPSFVRSPVRAAKRNASSDSITRGHASPSGRAAARSPPKAVPPPRGTSPDTAHGFHSVLTKTSQKMAPSAWYREKHGQIPRGHKPTVGIAASTDGISMEQASRSPPPPSHPAGYQPLQAATPAWHHVPPPHPTRVHAPHEDTHAVHAQSMAPALIERSPDTRRSPSVITLTSGPSSVDLMSFNTQRPRDLPEVRLQQTPNAHTQVCDARTVPPPLARRIDDLPHLPPADPPRRAGVPHSTSAQLDYVGTPSRALDTPHIPLARSHHCASNVSRTNSLHTLDRPDNPLLSAVSSSLPPDRPNALPPSQDRVNLPPAPRQALDPPQHASVPILPSSITEAPVDVLSPTKKKARTAHTDKESNASKKRHVTRPKSSENRTRRHKPSHRSSSSSADDCLVVESVEDNLLPGPSRVEDVLQRARDRQVARSADASYVNARNNAEKSLSKLQAIITATEKN